MAAAKSYPSSLLIDVNDLLTLQGVESQRVEFKKAWYSKKEIKGGTYWQIIHTITAFANDFYNVNGGYIIIGVEERKDRESQDNRQIVLPPYGVQGNVEKIQKEILGACHGNIKPQYTPILQPEVVQDKHVLVIWVRPSDERPHMCRESSKGGFNYYIREGAETKIAQKEQITHLCRYKGPPFDDRCAVDIELGSQLNENSIDSGLVQKYLTSIGSDLACRVSEPIHLYKQLQLVCHLTDKKVDEKLSAVFAPRNVALLFFNRNPDIFFNGARSEIAIFTYDNDAKEEKKLTGPIDQQIKKCLSSILEIPKKEACHAIVAYPERALREAVVNAFHHRSYESCDPDPVKIHIKPNFIEIISYPGPDPCLKQEHFSESKEVPPVPSRNRRIADFLKSMKLAEGRYTGVGTIFRSMKENNNPTPQFDFTTAYFRVRLPGHPKYIVHSVRSRADNLCAKGNKADAVKLITAFLEKNPTMWSETLIVKLIELLGDDKNDPKYSQHHSFIEERKQRRIPLKEKLSKWCETEILDISAGVKLVKNLVEEGAGISDVSCVVSKASDLCKKKGDHRQNLEALQNAHKLYEALGEVVLTDASVSFQYADCTFNLYVLNTETDEGSRQGNGSQERRNLLPLLQKAEDYVKTAKQLTMKDDFKNMSLQYRLLGYIHSQRCSIQKSNEKQVTDCYDKARLYDPNIEINSVFIPADSRSRYRSPSSAQNTKPERQTAETSKRVIRSWPPTGKSGSVD